MRKLAVTIALASTALVTTPALARDKSWYVGVDGGAVLVEDIKFDINNVKSAGTVDHRYGYDVDGVIGYDLGMFRLEAEVGYKSASVDDYRSSVTTPGLIPSGAVGNYPAGTYQFARGRTTALSFMVNGLVDFGDDDGIQGFVGGGVGVARVKERFGINSLQNLLNDSDTVFAYQGLAGVRAPITKHVDASIKYRFFTADNVKLVDVAGRGYNGRYRTHSLLAGLTYNFGEPAAPPPPPPPPPPPAPPPPEPAPVVATPCSPGPFIVFFEWDKSDVTPEAASILDGAIAQYQNCGNAKVMLAGFTDRSGTPKYNVGLSQRRNDAVRAYMTAHSIPDGSIGTEAFGEDPAHLRVQTADGVREVQNRRVEVSYGPGSGN
ncbi:OmpA family protein [Sphingomonas sp. PWP1-2]|uniref:OmpA family protein n=1 Tax=Sphingomonas sp. PWP1-2 TaxID=2804558 RepID=UPI003CF16704